MSRCAIGIDVGGTSARIALAGDQGKLLLRLSSRTGLTASGEKLVDSFERGVRSALEFAGQSGLPVAGIGLAMPGLIDEKGCVTGSCNLPGLNGVPVGRLLEKKFGLPVRMENDVSAAAFGEFHFGGHAGSSRRLLFLSIGTGIGGGMIVEGKLLRTARGCLGDPGHIIVDASGQSPCRCGGNGCLEAVASGWALVERAQRLGASDPSPKKIFECARAGDSTMSQLVLKAAGCVGVGLASLCVLLNPDTVALGGGVAMEAGESFREEAARTLRAHGSPLFSKDVRVVAARVGASAGLLGAAALVLFDSSQAIG